MSVYIEDKNGKRTFIAGRAVGAISEHNQSPNAHENLFSTKQSKLSGTPGQVVGFDLDGNAIAQEAPDAENMVSAPGGAISDMPASLGAGPYTIEYTEDDPSEVSADQIGYDGTQSGIQAETVQGAIDELDGEVDQLGAEMELVSNGDMLINSRWDVKDAIVNQRNQNEYTVSGYTIDMWRMDASQESAKLQIMDGFIRGVKTKTDYQWGAISQPVDKDLLKYISGKTVTLSTLRRGTGVSELVLWNDTTASPIAWRIVDPSTDWTISVLTATLPDDLTSMQCILYFDISEAGTGYTDFKAAKFELGSKQTLAHKEGDAWVLNDPPPNKALELLKCQSSQVFGEMIAPAVTLYGNDAFCFLPLPTTLRAMPTLVGTPIARAVADNTEITEQISLDKLCKNGITLRVQGAAKLAYIHGFFGLDSNL